MKTTDQNPLGLAIFGLFIAIGLSVGGYFISQTMLNSRVGANTATVKGLSERLVQANFVRMEVYFSEKMTLEAGVSPNREQMYRDATGTSDALVALLEATSLDPQAFKVVPISYNLTRNRDYEGKYTDETHVMSGMIKISTDQTDLVQEIFEQLAQLGATEFDLSIDGPHYIFDGLNDIKPDMLREATANARIAADEFAKNAGVQVGSIQSARQGGFSIRDANNENTQTAEMQKLVRVVSSITFYLDN